MQTVRNRDQIPQADKWALEDLYPTAEAWEQALLTLEAAGRTLKGFEGKLGGSARTLYDYLTRVEAVSVLASDLANYCMRLSDEDTRSPAGQSMTGRFTDRIVALEAGRSFETPEIMAIDEETLEGFYAVCPELERYRRYLTSLRRRRNHILSPAEERLLAAAGEMAQTPDTVFSILQDADMRYPDAVDAQGQPHCLSQSTFALLQESPDRALRRSAYEAYYDTIGQFRNTAAALLNAQNKQLKFFAQARRYDSAFEASLDGAEVPTQVYRSLIDTVHRHLDKLHRYVRLRKRLLKVEELHFYDIYAPLVPDAHRHIPFAQARQTVYDAMAPLGETYRKILREGFDSRWIDVYPNPGKRGGAYSAGARVHPYVLLNYTGTLDSQFTLAHEMGHAIHSYLSNQRQNPLGADYGIFVAEVASTCNEALLMEYLLGKTTDPKERAYLINHFLEQFKGTLYRQTMFAEFELTIGELTAQGQTLTAETLCKLYRELNERYFGPDMVVDDRIALEWARIPHFYYDFYVYQYATGYAAAIALSRRILSEGETAVRDYLGFLSGGCSKSSLELLKDAGVDMTGPEPVDRALELFGTLLDEMEALTREA